MMSARIKGGVSRSGIADGTEQVRLRAAGARGLRPNSGVAGYAQSIHHHFKGFQLFYCHVFGIWKTKKQYLVSL